MHTKECTLYRKTVDGLVHRQRLVYQQGKDYMTVYTRNPHHPGVDKETIYFTGLAEDEDETPESKWMVIPATKREEAWASRIDLLLDEGWDYDLSVASNLVPTFNWKGIPRGFRFGRILHDPNLMLLDGPLRYWEPRRGESVVVLVGDSKTKVYREDDELELPKHVVREIEDLYPLYTVLRGVWDGNHLVVWDVPMYEMQDRISFNGMNRREPRATGRFVHKHAELDPTDTEKRALLITQPTVEPGATAYCWSEQPRIMKGTFFVHPTRRGPRRDTALLL